MSDLKYFVAGVPDFHGKTAIEQLLIIAWYIEVRQNKPLFNSSDIRRCFLELNIDPPNVGLYLSRLLAKKPPQIRQEKGNFRLAGESRRLLDNRYNKSSTAVAVDKTLSDLPNQLTNIAQSEFLTEALSCYRVRAFRSAIVMTWNLAYDHIMCWLLSDPTRLSALNSGIQTRFPKKNTIIQSKEHFEALKESELIEAGRIAKILDKNTAQILTEKLNRRNMAAHPSNVRITQHQADDMITDLVLNIILKFKIN